MSSPTLTFTPAMFHAAHVARIKTVTRRLAQVSRQNHIDQLAEAIAKDAEMQFWTSHLHLAAHQPGEVKPMVTSWAVHSDWDECKPSDIEPDVIEGEIASQYSGGIWFDDGSEKPAWAGKSRPARFLPKSLYHLAPQVRIESAQPEPLQNITPDDARAEGIRCISKDGSTLKYGLTDRDGLPGEDDIGWAWSRWRGSAVDAYFHLWDTIHPDHRAFSNPIVWRYQFTVL